MASFLPKSEHCNTGGNTPVTFMHDRCHWSVIGAGMLWFPAGYRSDSLKPSAVCFRQLKGFFTRPYYLGPSSLK